jgi:hypothetical protein
LNRFVALNKALGLQQWTVPLSVKADDTPQDSTRFITGQAAKPSVALTGLEDCQSCDADKLDFHFNTGLTALNLAKADLLNQRYCEESVSFSIASYKRLALNEHLLERFISMFAIDPTLIKSLPAYDAMRSYGLITP